jgi:hypothetical protein
MMDTIKIKRDDGIVTVAKSDYIVAKTKQLIEFGYKDLEQSHVEEQVNLVLAGKANMNEGLTVIGEMITDDIVLDQPAEPSPPPFSKNNSIQSLQANPPAPKKRGKKGWKDEAHCIDGKPHYVVRSGTGLKCKLCNKKLKRKP